MQESNSTRFNMSVWTWTDATTTKERPITGRHGVVYPGDGYVVELPRTDRDAARRHAAFLEENQWLDLSTRFVIVTMVVYNPGVDVATVCLVCMYVHVYIRICGCVS